jgi:hypothetical protein
MSIDINSGQKIPRDHHGKVAHNSMLTMTSADAGKRK